MGPAAWLAFDPAKRGPAALRTVQQPGRAVLQQKMGRARYSGQVTYAYACALRDAEGWTVPERPHLNQHVARRCGCCGDVSWRPARRPPGAAPHQAPASPAGHARPPGGRGCRTEVGVEQGARFDCGAEAWITVQRLSSRQRAHSRRYGSPNCAGTGSPAAPAPKQLHPPTPWSTHPREVRCMPRLPHMRLIHLVIMALPDGCGKWV